jgi:hypothetical protein
VLEVLGRGAVVALAVEPSAVAVLTFAIGLMVLGETDVTVPVVPLSHRGISVTSICRRARRTGQPWAGGTVGPGLA